jgi:hypothetical protein
LSYHIATSVHYFPDLLVDPTSVTTSQNAQLFLSFIGAAVRRNGAGSRGKIIVLEEEEDAQHAASQPPRRINAMTALEAASMGL